MLRNRILKLKCTTKFRFRLGLRPKPRWGAHSALPDPYLDLRGPTSKGREGNGREKGRGGNKGERERGLQAPPLQTSGYA